MIHLKAPIKKGNKYHAQKTQYNGFMYDSKKEATFARVLDSMRKSVNKSDRVLTWGRQIPYEFMLQDKLIFTYYLDFLVIYSDGRKEYIDVKGYKKGCAYQMFRLKKKIIETEYGITIKEV